MTSSLHHTPPTPPPCTVRYTRVHTYVPDDHHQILDLMHACAADSEREREREREKRPAPEGDRGGESGAAAATVSGSGNGNVDEWGSGGGRAGLVQAYNHVIRVCGDAGGTEMALELLEEMHRR